MPKNKIKTIFIGTPEFALPALEALHNDKNFEIKLVITKPDAKVGRKQILTPPPVKTMAKNFQIPVMQPEKIAAIIPAITAIAPDIIIVVAYAQIIPENLLNLPTYGCINIHGSLLPKYRGAACIPAAITNGDEETGVTIMQMDKTLDTGPILAQATLTITDNDNYGTLYEQLAKLAAPLLLKTLKGYIAGRIKPQVQADELASYVRTIKKEDGRIDPNRTAVEIERLIRAMQPWPGAFTVIEGLTIKFIDVNHVPIKTKGAKPGQFFIYEDRLAFQAADDALEVVQIQPAGKKALNAKSFINGYKKYIYNT